MTYFNYFTNPFNLNKGRISKTLPKNQTIWQIVNKQKIDLSRPVVCFVNGVAKLRKDWSNPLSSQDVVSFISPIKDVYNVIINAIDAQSKSKFDIIILDETQRINTTQLDLILKFVRDNQLKCIISYDPIQTLSYMEKNSKAIPTIEASCTNKLELSEKIRTNKNLAHFIRSVFDLNKKSQIIPEDVSIIHFQNESTAKEYISTKNDFRLINYTPSRYYQDLSRKNKCLTSVLYL